MSRRRIVASTAALVIAAAGAALYAGVVAPGLEAGRKVMTNAEADTTPARERADDTPFACNMQAISAEERPRHVEVTGQMRQATREVKELPDGYAFRFDASRPTVMLVSEFISRERDCCPFFTFELVAERDEGSLWLSLRGREGVKEFIMAELEIEP
jgi:hypothetical protein